jgi:CheY-like chemotaxis protein
MVSSAVPPQAGSDFTSLAQARFALAGFAPDEARWIMAALAERGSLSHSVSPDADLLTGKTDSYSAVIVNLTSAAGETWIGDPRMLALKAPLLAIGSCDDVNAFPVMELHACEVMMRPFSKMELAIRLRRCLAKPEPGVAKPSTRRSPRVVVADDDASMSALVGGILASRGFECIYAENGWEALELTRSSLPDLLVLDVNMPFVNGFQVLSALRDDPSTSSMKILMLTGADRPEDMVQGLDRGATAYLCKPFKPFDFVLRIKDLFPDLIKTRSRDSLTPAHAVPRAGFREARIKTPAQLA